MLRRMYRRTIRIDLEIGGIRRRSTRCCRRSRTSTRRAPFFLLARVPGLVFGAAFSLGAGGVKESVRCLPQCQRNPFIGADGRVDLSMGGGGEGGAGDGAVLDPDSPLAFSLPSMLPGGEVDAQGNRRMRGARSREIPRDGLLFLLARGEPRGASCCEASCESPRDDGGGGLLLERAECWFGFVLEESFYACVWFCVGGVVLCVRRSASRAALARVEVVLHGWSCWHAAAPARAARHLRARVLWSSGNVWSMPLAVTRLERCLR